VVKSRIVVFSTRRKLGHAVAFYKILTFEAQNIPGSAIHQKKNSLVALPPFPKLSVKF